VIFQDGRVDYSGVSCTKRNITSGIFTPSDELAKEITAASEISGEKFWRLPMEESYWEGMKSGVADMVNTGGRQGGSITAALFLKQV
jgi:leucyl aminopeptidase